MNTKIMLRVLRERRGLSQLQLSKEAGVSQGLISYIESGTVNPTSKALEKLAKALNVPVGELFREPTQEELQFLAKDESK